MLTGNRDAVLGPPRGRSPPAPDGAAAEAPAAAVLAAAAVAARELHAEAVAVVVIAVAGVDCVFGVSARGEGGENEGYLFVWAALE